jgi:hypothetical protein
MPPLNKFIIIREDLVQDPVTIISDGLLVGRLGECELLLNHPAVSRAQAGIKEVNGSFYLFPLRTSNPVLLNGKPVETNEALAPGDVLEVLPFLLEIDRADDALVIKVSLQIGIVVEVSDSSSPRLATTKLLDKDVPGEKKKAPERAAPLPGDKALDIFWDKRIREAGKMVRPSPLFPRSQRRSGKAQFNWTATTDLVSRWPPSIFIWATVVVGLLSVAAALWYTSAFSPGPVSHAHAKSKLDRVPPIAIKPNSDSCTSCHSLTASMETNCAACHTAEGFVATVIEPHAAAGIGCVTCHAEHRGSDFNAAQAALHTCTDCHSDANPNSFNGRRVSTPHGGTFGYPVTQEKWTWKGLSDSEWALKQIAITRLPSDTDEQWRSKQFHALHVQRVRSIPGSPGNLQGQLSCSSCHNSFNPIDRETPRATCGACHNGSVELQTRQMLIAENQPNCISCHVQHVKNKKHWNPALMAVGR